MTKDWIDWHADYHDAESSLSQRLEVVRHHIRVLISLGPSCVVSVCSGRGDDLLAVLADEPGRRHIDTWLIENHPRLAAQARKAATGKGLAKVRVLEADGGAMSTYRDIAPADLVTMCGVFGNITDDDIYSTIDLLPQLVTEGGYFVWTRSRRHPDVTPAIRSHLADLGFLELDFVAPEDHRWSVGVNRFEGKAEPFDPAGRLFEFIV